MRYDTSRGEFRLSLGDSNNALIKLIAINLIVFITLSLCRAYYFFFYQDMAALEAAFRQQVLQWFVLSPDLSKLISRPWTFFVFPFASLGVWMILGNMLWLWAFGFILQDLSGYRRMIPLYLYGGWAGGIAYLITAQFMKMPLDTIGYYNPAPSVMAIAVATTLLTPNYRIMPDLRGGFPLWILTAFYVLISIATQPIDQPQQYLPLIAGGLTGFLFMYLLQKGYDTSRWMSNFFEWAQNLFNPDKARRS
jgi:membrane associated rhomboid family serine protease